MRTRVDWRIIFARQFRRRGRVSIEYGLPMTPFGLGDYFS